MAIQFNTDRLSEEGKKMIAEMSDTEKEQLYNAIKKKQEVSPEIKAFVEKQKAQKERATKAELEKIWPKY